jgi:hypothetical protein
LAKKDMDALARSNDRYRFKEKIVGYTQNKTLRESIGQARPPTKTRIRGARNVSCDVTKARPVKDSFLNKQYELYRIKSKPKKTLDLAKPK